MFDLQVIQTALHDFGFGGWLMCDFRGSNVLARRILDIPHDAVMSRRLYYYIPAVGEPVKLVHRIEAAVLDHLPGKKMIYLEWQQLEAAIGQLVGGAGKVAMEYSPRNAIPYISRVDAGTVELVRSFGAEVVGSGDLIQLFESTWDDAAWQSHLESAEIVRAGFDVAWAFIASEVRQTGSVSELAVQDKIMEHFSKNGLYTDHPPIVGVGPHSGDPHYAPSPETESLMKEGDFVLLDCWAKLEHPDAVYSDYTRVGFIGQSVPEKYEALFGVIVRGRDAAIDLVREAFASGRTLQGWEVDRAARDVIEAAGYGEAFCHRLGHNIGRETHGNGANMDNLETRDERTVMRRTCFSIEPGIYLPEFGVRTEVDVFIDAQGQVHVTGGERQMKVVPILAEF